MQAMAGMLQRRRRRAETETAPRCFVCGSPVLPSYGGVEVEGRIFHDTCLQGSVEGRTYSQLYGDRSGDVTPAGDRRGD